MRQLRLVGAWLIVVAAATTVTWQIVNAAEGQVNNTPLPPIAAEPPSTSVTVTPASTSTTEGLTSSSIATTVASTTPSSTSPTTTTPQTTSSSAPATTTGAWTLRTIPSAGGTVTVRYRFGEVEYVSATPAAGFQTEVADKGPPKVRVEFDAHEQDVRIDVKWEDSGLQIEISGDSEGNDD